MFQPQYDADGRAYVTTKGEYTLSLCPSRVVSSTAVFVKLLVQNITLKPQSGSAVSTATRLRAGRCRM